MHRNKLQANFSPRGKTSWNGREFEVSGRPHECPHDVVWKTCLLEPACLHCKSTLRHAMSTLRHAMSTHRASIPFPFSMHSKRGACDMCNAVSCSEGERHVLTCTVEDRLHFLRDTPPNGPLWYHFVADHFSPRMTGQPACMLHLSPVCPSGFRSQNRSASPCRHADDSGRTRATLAATCCRSIPQSLP